MKGPRRGLSLKIRILGKERESTLKDWLGVIGDLTYLGGAEDASIDH